MKHQIPVFKAEKEDGLSDLIKTSGSVAYASAIEIASQEEIKKLVLAHAVEKTYATNMGQIDLHYLKTILATVGWNKNDDVFDKIETWMARATPEDKPFNIEHDPAQIVGHITGNYAIDADGGTLSDNCSVDELPDKYHIVTSAVLYKFLKCPKPELEEKMEKIIAEIAEGKWFVSMEALFSNFDYAVIGSDGKTHVLPRTDESAFLTKHLRAYGGTGKYEDYRIGRFMRNIVFSGKGLVAKPANPESIIFREVATFKTNANEIFQLQKNAGYVPISKNATQGKIKESNIMTVDNDTLQQIKSLEASLVVARQQNEDLQKRLNETNEKQVQAKIADLESQLKAKEDRITSLAAQVKTEQEGRSAAEESLKKASEELGTTKANLTQVKAEQTEATRIARWVDHTGLDVAVATKKVKSLSKLDDAEFEEFLKNEPAKAAAPQTQQNVNATVLENVTPEKEPSLSTAGVKTNEQVEQARANLGAFIANSFLRKGKNASKSEN